jgi:diguanylate cyclase (GGDEF)-like protein
MPGRKLTAQRQNRGARQRSLAVSWPLHGHGRVNQQNTLDAAARLACQLLKGDIAAISLADEEGHLAVHSHFGLTEECAARLRANARYSPLGLIAGKNARPHIVSGQKLEDLTPGLNLKTMLVMPLKTGKVHLGYLGVGYRRQRNFTRQQLQLAKLFADYATIGIETTHLYEEERFQRNRSGALLDAAAASSARLSLEAILTRICRSVLKVSVAERCGIYLLAEDRTRFETGLTLGDISVNWMPQVDVDVNDFVTPQAMNLFSQTHKPVVVDRIPGAGIMAEEQVQNFNVKSVAAYPLLFRRRTIGLLVTSTYSNFVSFPKEEVDTLAAIAKHAAVIIENARLYERERRQRQRSEALARLLTAASSTFDLQQRLKEICEGALDLTVGDSVSIFLNDAERKRLVPVMAVGQDDNGGLEKFLAAPAALLRDPETRRVYRSSVSRKKPFIVEDAAASPWISRWWTETFDTRSIVQYPLRVQGKTIGVMNASSHGRKVHFSSEEIETLSAVAKQAAVIIENARIYQREAQERKQSETLSAVLTAATSTLSLREVLSKVCEATLSLTVGDAVSVFLIDEETGGSVPVMAAGRRVHGSLSKFLTAPQEATKHLGAQNFFKAIARRKTPLLIKDATASPYVSPWWVEKFGVKSMVAYPLLVKGKTIGALVVDSAGSTRFPREEVEALAPVARQVAVIIENARLYEHEQRQRQRSEKISQALAPASATLSLRQACLKVCEAAAPHTVGDTVSIFLRTEDGLSFMPIAETGLDSESDMKAFKNPPKDVQAGEDVRSADRVLSRLRKPLIIQDVNAAGLGHQWWIRNFGLKSISLYPMWNKDRMIGFLASSAIREKKWFSKEEQDALSAIARQAAVIIENARLYERQQLQTRRAETLVDVLSYAGSSVGLRKVLAQLCQAVVDISVADRVSIFMMSEDETFLEPVMSYGFRDSQMWDKFRNPQAGFRATRASRQLFEAMLTIKEPLVADDATTSPFIDKWWVKTFGIKSIVQYPLRVKDKTIGMLCVDSFEEPVHFPREEVDTIAAIAQQAGVLIENARVYEREQEQRQRAEALLGVLTSAASNLGLKKVLVKICQTVVDLSVADRCSIFVIDEHGRLKPMMALGIEDPEAWQRFQNAQALAGSHATSPELREFYANLANMEEPVIVDDTKISNIVPKWWREAFNVKSLVHYPLRIKDKTIGLLSVDAFQHHVQFPKEEIETIAAIARQAAVVIENARLHEQLQQQAVTDHITGLFNHRYMFQRLDEEFARAERSGGCFSVMMMDLDKFKDINDTYGHLEGDEALRFTGHLLRDTLRAADIIGRYGGDEFMAILPDTNREQAEEVAERLMEILHNSSFRAESLKRDVPIAASIGFAAYPQDSTDREQLLLLADTALYEAKRLGGQRALRVSAKEEEPPAPTQSPGFELLQGLLNAIAHKDPHMHQHCEDNVRFANLMSERLNLPEETRESLRKAALLHDVGKIAVPDQTLLKPGPLDTSEWEIMQQHVRFGEMIVKSVSQISDAIEPVATHHERYDGTGYPRGLKGDEIPLLGRILAVVDAYSAMTLDRPYRKALTEKETIAELRKGAGTQFDPGIVEAFLAVLAEARRERRVA